MKTRKNLSRAAAFFLLLLLAMQIPIISKASNFNSISEPSGIELPLTGATADAHIVSEDKSLRDEFTKHFVLSDGSMLAAAYNVPVHYYDDEWKEIDNTLVSEGKAQDSEIQGFANTESGVKYKFAQSSAEAALLEMTADGYSVSWEFVADKNAVPAEVTNPTEENGNSDEDILNGSKVISSVKYTNILNDTDIEYILRGNDVKENIVIKAAKDNYTYSFRIKVNGATLTLNDDSSVSIVKDGKTVKTIPSAFMTDANGAYGNAVETSLTEESNGVYMFTVTADKAWVDSAAFPVTIDPQLNDGDTVNYTVTKTQLTENGGENLGEGVVWTGHSTAANAKARFHVSVPVNYMVGFDDYIINAKINLTRNALSDGKENVVLGAYAATTYFNKNNAHYGSVGVATDASDKVLVNNSDAANTVYGIDITSVVRMWMRGESENKGVIIEADNVGDADAYAAFDAAAGDAVPACVIRYRSAHGLADGFSFHKIDLGNGGTAYINDATGNLVVVRDDVTCLLKGRTTNISGVYNSIMPAYFSGTDDFYGTQMKSGNGWKLNVQEKITGLEAAADKTHAEGERLYSYVDSTGTKRYFVFVSYNETTHETTMKDTDGLGLTLVFGYRFGETIRFKLTDSDGNAKYFDNFGYIVRDEEKNGTAVEYTYEGGQYVDRCITELTDAYGTTTFEYNEDRTVKKVTDRFGSTKNYTYDANGNLVRVSDSDGTLATYSYSGTKLVDSVDTENGIRVLFSYTGNRLSSIQIFNGDALTDTSSIKQEISLEIKNNESTIIVIDHIRNEEQTAETISRPVCHEFFDAQGRLSASIDGTSVKTYEYADNTLFFNNIIANANFDDLGNNLIKDLNASAYDFSEFGANAGGSVSVNTDFAYTGAASLSVSSAAVTDMYGYAKTFTVPETGTYTFRAFVKPANLSVSETSDGGAALRILNNTSSASATSDFVESPTEASNNNGWSLVCASLECAAGDSVTLVAGIENATGTALFDCLNFDKGEARSINLLSNNGFENGFEGWTSTGFEQSNSAKTGSKSISASENASAQTSAYIGLSSERSFTLSGWIKGDIYENNGASFVGLKAKVYYTVTKDGVQEQKTAEYSVPAEADIDNWQFVSTTFVIPKEATTVTIDRIDAYVVSESALSTVLFDDISLVMNEAVVRGYTEAGKTLSEDDFLGNRTDYAYTADGRLSGIETEYTQTTYSYDDTAKTSTEIFSEFTAPRNDETRVAKAISVTKKDRYDNTLLATVSYSENSLYTYAEYTYDSTYNYVTSEKDGRGSVTAYTYDAFGNKLSQTDANGTVIRYIYNEDNLLTEMYFDSNNNGTCDEGEREISYLYTESGELSSLSSNGRTYTYLFTETDAKKIASVLSGDTAVASYEYNGDKITKITYANGDIFCFAYNESGKLIETVQANLDSIDRYTYTYNDDGLLEKVWIHKMNAGYFYTYDENREVILTEFKYLDTSVQPNEYKTLLKIHTDESSKEHIGFGYEFGSVKLGYQITSDENSTTISLKNTANENNPLGIFSKTTTVDILGRKISEAVSDTQSENTLSATYEYVSGTETDEFGNTAATELVGKITYSDGSARSYTYDANGNILTVSFKSATSTTPVLEESYVYDALGQVVEYNDFRLLKFKTVKYSYDRNGNIVSEDEYLYRRNETIPETPASTVTYSYTDSEWKDKLTSINNSEVVSNANGAPESYRGYTFVWKGLQLRRATNNGNTATYVYNEDGIRVMKEYLGIKTRFLLDGTNIIAQEVTNNGSLDYIYFFYDASGSPIGMNYLGYNYYYKKNLQGDIIEIWGTEDGSENHTFRRLVEYKYDIWGKISQMNDSTAGWFKVGTANPFRYRGYYYDNESDFYYVTGRYYDPEIGRWIGANDTTAPSGVATWNNAFAYCSNNAVNRKEKNSAFSTLGKIIKQNSLALIEKYMPSVIYDVPVYTQGKLKLCWAYCQIMVEDFRSGILQNQAEADIKAKELAILVNGEQDWNQGGFPTNSGDEIYCDGENSARKINSVYDLYTVLKEEGPIYAYYSRPGKAHLVVVTGVDLKQGIVYTNNPWGIAGRQTYTQFTKGFAGGRTDGMYSLKLYILITR